MIVGLTFAFACGAPLGVIGYAAARADLRRRAVSEKSVDVSGNSGLG